MGSTGTSCLDRTLELRKAAVARLDLLFEDGGERGSV